MSEHHHVDEHGLVVKCYHECKSILTDWRFIAGMTLSFPFEHFLYEHIWPFTILTKFLEL